MKEASSVSEKQPVQNFKAETPSGQEDDSGDSTGWWLLGLIVVGSAAYAIGTKQKTS